MNDRRRKPKPEDVPLVPQAEFERELAVLFQVPPAEVSAAEAERPKRQRRSKAAHEKGAA